MAQRNEVQEEDPVEQAPDERYITLPNGSQITILQYEAWRNTTIADATQLIAANEQGQLTEQQKTDLPDTVQSLRDILAIQLDDSQAIRRRDLRDTNYSNVGKDRTLRYQLRVLRNLDLSLHAPFGTAWGQMFSNFIVEDISNFCHIESLRFTDYVRQFVKVGGGALGGGIAGGVLGMLGGNALVPGPGGVIGGGVVGAALGGVGGYLAIDRWFRNRAHRRYPILRGGTPAGLHPALA
ncbi:MAG: hypothetical protein HOO67_03985 [Candidatus Peribacteraceae bacterium]|nr:hypothetical protein [Candidatus Peribacteraceae bacterium]